MTALRAVAAGRLLLGEEVLEQPLILLQDGRIEQIATQQDMQAPEGTLHLTGHTLAPGFLDIHVHGAGGRDVMEGSAEAIRATGAVLARYGATRYLPTTVTATVEHTLRALETLADEIEAKAVPGSAKPVGIHLEGPFLSHAKRGVHPPDQLQKPSIPLFERFFEAARGHIRLMTIAPEIEGAAELIGYAARRGVRLSMGHSNATAAETRRGIEASRAAAPQLAVSATHTFNAMRAFDHREPGILGVTLDDEQMFAELICDGIHTTPEAVRLWFRCKAETRGILVTDGMAATGMPDGDYKLGNLDVTVRDGVCSSGGVLAGSVLTMDRAIANLQRFTGAALDTAVRMATRNPATLLGMPEAEAPLNAGSEASFSVFREDGSFRGTILRGEPLFPF